MNRVAAGKVGRWPVKVIWAGLVAAAVVGGPWSATAFAQSWSCPSDYYSGSVGSGDGSTVPGAVSIIIHCVDPGCGQDTYVWGGPPGGFTLPGPSGCLPEGSSLTVVYDHYAINGFYFPSAHGSPVTCTNPGGEGGSWTCSGSPSLMLFAKQGALEGSVTINPPPSSADLRGITVFARLAGAGPFDILAFTNAQGNYEKRSQVEPNRSNNWGMNVFTTESGPTGPVTSSYDVLVGPQMQTVSIASSRLSRANFEIPASYCKDPELRCLKNGPPSSVGGPVDVITGNVFFDHQDSQLPGLGFARSYNSRHAYRNLTGLFGRGWSSSHESRLTFPDTRVVELMEADGVPIYYHDADSDLTYEASLPATEMSTLVQDATGYTRLFHEGGSERYDLQGKLLSSVDLAGRTTTLTRNGSGQVVKITVPSGRSLEFVYDANGKVSTLLSEGLELAAYEYDPGPGSTAGTLMRVAYAEGSGYTYSYDSAGQMIQVADLSGRIVEMHSYDASGRGLTSELADGREKYTLSYDTDNQRTTVMDAFDNSTIYTWNSVKAFRRITKIEGPCAGCGGGGGTNERWSYDTLGRMLTHTDSLERTTSYEYDPIGELAAVMDPLNRRTEYVRDTKGRITSTTAPGNVVTSATYGNAGPLTLKDALNRTTTMTYTTGGEVQTLTDPRGKVTTMAYGSNRDLLSVTDPLSQQTTFGYDANGRRTLVRDALGHDTTTNYDGRGRVTRITSHDGTHTDFAYDAGGRRVSVSDPLERVTRYAYDRYGWLRGVIDPLGQSTSYTYDLMGRLTLLEDAKGNGTAFEYDAYGRVKKVTYPGGANESFTYDQGSQLTTRVDRKGVTTTYAYDGLGRLTGKTYSDGTTPAVTYTYDTVGRLATAANGTDVLTWSYDLAGQLLSEQSNKNSSTVAYTYDVGGNRLTLGLDGALFVSYAYDDTSRLTSITRGANVFGFGYDNANRRTSLTYPNGINTAYTYDNLNRLTRLKADLSTTPITDFQYLYDAAGNRTKKQQLDYTEDYSYDSLYRLTGVERSAGLTGINHYEYDPVGNRITNQINDSVLTSAFNEKNQLTGSSGGGALKVRGTLNEPGTAKVNGSPARMLAGNVFEATIQATTGTNTFAVEATDQSGNITSKNYQVSVSATGATYTYDPNGNLTQKVEGADTWVYEWNAENELKRVLKNSVEQARFAYDPIGRRVEKISGGLTVKYTYDRAEILREQRGSTDTRYIHGVRADEPLASESGGVLNFYQRDGLGTVVGMTNAAGQTISAYRYSGFGARENGASADGYAFTSREWDAETGLYYYRARYYDSASGRFLTEDPIGFAGGLNLYAYVGSNPVNYIDPLGLKREAKWIVPPHVSGITATHDGVIWPGTYTSVEPPQVGIFGIWWLIKGGVAGTVECKNTDECKGDTVKVRDMSLTLQGRIGIGFGITTLPRVHYALRGGKIISSVADAIDFYRNQWTQLAKQLSENPMTWCILLGGF